MSMISPIFTTTLCVCVQILLHDPNDQPMMIERGLKVAPGASTQIAVTAIYVSIRNVLNASTFPFVFEELRRNDPFAIIFGIGPTNVNVKARLRSAANALQNKILRKCDTSGCEFVYYTEQNVTALGLYAVY